MSAGIDKDIQVKVPLGIVLFYERLSTKNIEQMKTNVATEKSFTCPNCGDGPLHANEICPSCYLSVNGVELQVSHTNEVDNADTDA